MVLKGINMNGAKAYTLLELLITIAIVAILSVVSYQLYVWHIVSTRRADAQLALLKLSSALENYYLQHNTYEGATLAKINFPEKSPQGFYRMSFELDQNNQSYAAKATPLGDQAKRDKACGTLILMTDGRRSYQGEDQKAVCW